MMISYKLEKAAASMKRLRFETLLSPASISREAALLLLGFRVSERSPERMGGAFRIHSQNISVGRATWAAEIMSEIFWSQFLWTTEMFVDGITAELRPGAHTQLSFSVMAQEREKTLEQVRRQEMSVLRTPILARSPSGLVVGEIIVNLRVRHQLQLQGNAAK